MLLRVVVSPSCQEGAILDQRWCLSQQLNPAFIRGCFCQVILLSDQASGSKTHIRTRRTGLHQEEYASHPSPCDQHFPRNLATAGEKARRWRRKLQQNMAKMDRRPTWLCPFCPRAWLGHIKWSGMLGWALSCGARTKKNFPLT